MEEIFIKKEKRTYINCEIYYIVFEKNGFRNKYYFYSEKIIPDEVKDKTISIKAKFLKPTFQELSYIKKESILFTKEGYSYRDDSMYQQNIIKNLLKKIITDTEEVEIDDENYSGLDPHLADALYNSFNVIFLNPEVLKEDII